MTSCSAQMYYGHIRIVCPDGKTVDVSVQRQTGKDALLTVIAPHGYTIHRTTKAKRSMSKMRSRSGEQIDRRLKLGRSVDSTPSSGSKETWWWDD